MRGEIVITVPRWIIAAVGLLMLLLGLSAAFILFLVGLHREGVLATLFILVMVPTQLLIAYIAWRFYWYFLLVGMMLQGLCACTIITGLAGVPVTFRGTGPLTPYEGVILAIAQARVEYVLIAFMLALVVVAIIAAVLMSMAGQSAEPLKRGIPHQKPPNYYPPLDDPFWDDPRK